MRLIIEARLEGAQTGATAAEATRAHETAAGDEGIAKVSNNAIRFRNAQVLVFVKVASRYEYEGLRNTTNREAAMPASFLSTAQRESYGRYAGDPSTDELARYFHLDDADRVAIAEKRGDHNRLGFALQLTTARSLGTFLEKPTDVPSTVLHLLSKQLAMDGTDLEFRPLSTIVPFG